MTLFRLVPDFFGLLYFVNHLVSFGDDLYRYQKTRLRSEASLAGWFDSVEIHDPSSIRGFLDVHGDFVRGSRGYGYWIWKPHIILDCLSRMRDGDFLFYVDAGASILPHRSARFAEYLSMMRSSPCPVMGFFDGGSFGEPPQYKERMFQKRRVLRRFGLERDSAFLESGQIEGGVIACMRSDFTVSFFREWMDLVLEDGYSLVDDTDDLDQMEGFLGHRHDQSLLSVLCKLRGSVMLGAVECYGLGPFFSSRLTDLGSKERAPDGFRREPDYDQNRHHDWSDYLSDPLVVSSAVDLLKGLISGVRFSFGEDPKARFMEAVFSEVERVQFGKGLHKISVEFFETSREEASRWECLCGVFSCEFISGASRSFNFVLTSSGVEFPGELPSKRRLYRTEYSRTWDCNY